MAQEQVDVEQLERDFAQSVIDENADILQALVNRAGDYVEQGRADKLYLLVKALNTIMAMAQHRMKQVLGIDGARVN